MSYLLYSHFISFLGCVRPFRHMAAPLSVGLPLDLGQSPFPVHGSVLKILNTHTMPVRAMISLNKLVSSRSPTMSQVGEVASIFAPAGAKYARVWFWPPGFLIVFGLDPWLVFGNDPRLPRAKNLAVKMEPKLLCDWKWPSECVWTWPRYIYIYMFI